MRARPAAGGARPRSPFVSDPYGIVLGMTRNKEISAAMNRFLAGSRHKRGVIDHLRDIDTSDRAAALAQVTQDFDRAAKAGDETAMAIADDRIDRLFAEARAARQQAETDHQEPPVSFDGGVRRPLIRRQRPSMNTVIQGAVAAQRAVEAMARDSV